MNEPRYVEELAVQLDLIRNDAVIAGHFPNFTKQFEAAIDAYYELVESLRLQDIGPAHEGTLEGVQLRNLIRKAKLNDTVVIVKILTRPQEFGESDTLRLLNADNASVVRLIDGGPLQSEKHPDVPLWFVITEYLPSITMVDVPDANSAAGVEHQVVLMTQFAERLHLEVAVPNAGTCVDRFSEQLETASLLLKPVADIKVNRLVSLMTALELSQQTKTLLTGDFHGGNVLVPTGTRSVRHLDLNDLVFIDPQPPTVGLPEADIGYMCGAYALRKQNATADQLRVNVELACTTCSKLDPASVGLFAGIYGIGIATKLIASPQTSLDEVKEWVDASLALT